MSEQKMRLWLRENAHHPEIKFDKWVATIAEAETEIKKLIPVLREGDSFVLIGNGQKTIAIWDFEGGKIRDRFA